MAKEGSGAGWVGVISVGVGAAYLLGVYQQLRRRAVDPDGRDPAWQLSLMIRWGCPALALAVVVANVVVFSREGIAALLIVLALDVVLVLGIAVLAIRLWELAEGRRRQTGYVICEASYVHAPRHIKSSMRRIYRSGRSVRAGRAFHDQMFGDVQLDQLVYSAAQRAVLGSEVSEAVRELEADAEPEDREILNQAREQLREIRQYLDGAEAALKRTAETAGELSHRITAPERERAAEQAAAAAARRRQQALSRVQDATAKASTRSTVEARDVEDRVSSAYAGYEEAAQVSENVLRGLSLAPGNEDPDAKQSPPRDRDTDAKRKARDAVWKAAKATTGTATRISAAAREGANKIRTRHGEN